MNEASIVGCLLAIILPWLCGYFVVRAICGSTMVWSCQLAHGYLVGLLITTLVFRLFDAAGITFSFWAIALCLLLITGIGYLALKLRPEEAMSYSTTRNNRSADEQLSLWTVLLIALTLAVIIYKIFLATNEVVLRPLFPWDAWNSWAPLTIQYYESGGLTAEFQTRASAHGKTVSIIHLWGMLACETPSHPLTRLSWLFAWLTLALALFSHIKMHTSSSVAAIAGAYLCVSLPALYIHTALSGYADIWLVLAFTLGVLTLSLYSRTPHPGLIALTITYAVACASIKESGLLMSACLLILLILKLGFRLPRAHPALFVSFSVVVVALALVVLQQLPLTLDIPLVGTLGLSSTALTIPGLPTYQLRYQSIALPLAESLLLFSQLHLLTYLTGATILMVVLLKRWQLLTESSFLAIVSGGILIWAYFSLADFAGAAQHTGLTRALICLVPPAIYWCVISWAEAIRNSRTLQVKQIEDGI